MDIFPVNINISSLAGMGPNCICTQSRRHLYRVTMVGSTEYDRSHNARPGNEHGDLHYAKSETTLMLTIAAAAATKHTMLELTKAVPSPRFENHLQSRRHQLLPNKKL